MTTTLRPDDSDLAGALERLQARLLALANASASIVASPELDAVLSASIGIAREVFAADACAVWRVDANGVWRVARAFGISDTFAARLVAFNASRPARRELDFAEPQLIENVASAPLVAQLREEYAAEGVASLLVFPLAIRGIRTGTMVFYFHRPRSFDAADVQAGTALANLTAAALTTAEIYEEQKAARIAADHARDQAAFLAEASTVLSASLDYEETLARVARLAVPSIADWCTVDIVDDRGAVQRLAVAHVDPAKVQYANELQRRYPPDPNSDRGVYEVLRTGRASMMSRIPASLLESLARDDERRRIITELGLTSYMCVPMIAHGKAFGAITFVTAESGREYTDADLRFAEALAARASLAVENARAYARAAEANRLKDEFLATLSHELRTPLNAVLGYARMLRVGSLPAERTQAALDILERNATALKQMIEDVLDVSRIVSGRLRLQVQPVDLPAILEEACATVMPAAEAKGVRLERIAEPIASPVFGDPDRLQQIAWNLLSNAIRFTPRGGKVQLRVAPVNSHVEISVSDTGQGIAPAFLPFVFDRFRQGDATLAREHGGLGLGLAIARHLTELHGGTIHAASDGPGKGATFTVVLPLMIVHGTAAGTRDHPHSDRQAPVAAGAPRLDGVRVLAVDDEPDSLGLLRAVLESAGARVTIAASAAEALEILRRDPPDTLIADIGMPGMDGLSFIRAVRGLEQPGRTVPAAALSAYARSQDRIASLASGFQLHLVKPIDPTELLTAVSALARPVGL